MQDHTTTKLDLHFVSLLFLATEAITSILGLLSQKFVLCLDGPVVTAAGHENLLVVVSHASNPLLPGERVELLSRICKINLFGVLFF